MRTLFGRYPLYACSALIVAGCVVQPWDAYFSGDSDYAWPTEIVLDQTGKPVIAGLSVDPQGDSRHFVAKYSSSGKLLWTQLLGLPVYGFSVVVPRQQRIVTDALGGVFATGITRSSTQVLQVELDLLKVSVDGQVLWSTKINNVLAGVPFQVALDADDNHWVLVAVDGIYELRVYNADGDLLWQRGLADYDGFRAVSSGGSLGDLSELGGTSDQRPLDNYLRSTVHDSYPLAHPFQFDAQGNAYIASARSLVKVAPDGTVLLVKQAADLGIAQINDTGVSGARVLVSGQNTANERVFAWLDTDLQLQTSHILPAAQGWTQVAVLDADQVCFMTSEYSESAAIHYQVGAVSATQGLRWQNSLNHTLYAFVPGSVIAADAHCHASRTEQSQQDYHTQQHIVTRYSINGEAQELVSHQTAFGAGFALQGSNLYSLQATDMEDDPDAVQSWLARRLLQ